MRWRSFDSWNTGYPVRRRLPVRSKESTALPNTDLKVNQVLYKKAREVLGPAAEIQCTTLQLSRLPYLSFDVVTLWDVLEHVPDPVNFLGLAALLPKAWGISVRQCSELG